MYLLGEQPAYADQLINRLQSIPTRLLEGLQPAGEPLRLERVDDLAKVLPGNQLFIIENGLLHALVDERPLFYLQEIAHPGVEIRDRAHKRLQAAV